MSDESNVPSETDFAQFAQFPPQKRAVLESLAAGSSVTAACQAAGVGRRTFYDWQDRKHSSYDAAFERAVMLSEEAATSVIEDAAWLHARAGNARLIEFWLTNRSAGRWKKTQSLEMTGKDGGPIRTVAAKDLTDDELARIAVGGAGTGPGGDGATS